MNIISSKCIILRQRDFRERDRMVTFLTDDKGKMTGIAKGSKVITSRSVGSYEPFSHGRIFYVTSRNSDLVSIRKIDPTPPYLYVPLQNSYDKYLFAAYITELVELCSKEPGEDLSLFEVLEEGLARIANCDPQTLPMIRMGFDRSVLRCLGLQPAWGQCVNCGEAIFLRDQEHLQPRRKTAHQFDADKGGIICPDCSHSSRNRLSISAETLDYLAAWRDQTLQSGSEDRVAPPKIVIMIELQNAISNHLAHHLGRVPKSQSLLPKLG